MTYLVISERRVRYTFFNLDISHDILKAGPGYRVNKAMMLRMKKKEEEEEAERLLIGR